MLARFAGNSSVRFIGVRTYTFYITRRVEEGRGEERAHELGRRWLLYRRGEVKRGRASVESIRRWVEGLCTLQCRNLPENQDFHQLSDKDGNSTRREKDEEGRGRRTSSLFLHNYWIRVLCPSISRRWQFPTLRDPPLHSAIRVLIKHDNLIFRLIRTKVLPFSFPLVRS